MLQCITQARQSPVLCRFQSKGLRQDQKEVVRMFATGRDMQVTGATGSGKTMSIVQAISDAVGKRIMFVAAEALVAQVYACLLHNVKQHVSIRSNTYAIGSEQSRIMVVSTAWLETPLAQANSFLDQINCVVMDEYDLILKKAAGGVVDDAEGLGCRRFLAYLAERRHVQVVMMSATPASPVTDLAFWQSLRREGPGPHCIALAGSGRIVNYRERMYKWDPSCMGEIRKYYPGGDDDPVCLTRVWGPAHRSNRGGRPASLGTSDATGLR